MNERGKEVEKIAEKLAPYFSYDMGVARECATMLVDAGFRSKVGFLGYDIELINYDLYNEELGGEEVSNMLLPLD